MIFVTVGTHEQQFNRLVRAVDDFVADGTLDDSVFIQTGYSDYQPAHCEWSRFLPVAEMRFWMREADVVVTHGGPSSFIEAMSVGKVPVVVPRLFEYGEHVNDHQVDFVRKVAERKGGIVPLFNVADLPSAISKVRIASSECAFRSHNASFCADLYRLISEL